MQRIWRPLARTARQATPASWVRHQSNGPLPQAKSFKLLYAATGSAIGGIAASVLLAKEARGDTSGPADKQPPGRPKRQYATRDATLTVRATSLLRQGVSSDTNRYYPKALDEIRSQIGEDAVSIDLDDVEEHGYSEWSTSNTVNRPVAVIRPSSTEDVSFVAKVCSKYGIPMVPFGAGSSVEGNFSSPYGGVCIDLSRMDKIVEFHPDDMDVVVQAGVNWMNLNESIKDSGLFLPLDPSPTALVGGMIATNCSGTNAMRYGTMKDYVLNLTVVLADGSIIKTRHRPRKTSAGYNLNALFTGSEGTLGIITEATLRLAIIPEKHSVALATFPSLKAATDAASAMIRRGVNLAAIELMDDVQMRVVNLSGGAGGRKWEEAATLFLK